ncbi:MAG TPA: helix-turn-helix transcriptional regulator [Actinomycetota bacterium]|nr:helix-turn-helix transcriptional regulator [Actinomycetota bacterium]
MATPITDVEDARDAFARGEWAEAYERYASADVAHLSPADLEAFADSAWWTSRQVESFSIRQRACTSYEEAGDPEAAARCSSRLCIEHALRGDTAASAGWLMRAQRLVEGSSESRDAGFVMIVRAHIAIFRGDPATSIELAQRAAGIGRRLRDLDLTVMGVQVEGLARLASGDLTGGMALLDEAMTSVVAGELTPYTTGIVYCNVLEACLRTADLGRAREWNDAASAWCDALPPGAPFPGICRVNRIQIADLGGAWPEAEAEAILASHDLLELFPHGAAVAFYETGEMRRRCGDLAAAEEAFRRAHELGMDPQPGLALLRHAQGRPDPAVTALRLAMDADPGDGLRRARLLAAVIEVALDAGRPETIHGALEELDGLSAAIDAPAIHALAATAHGWVELADDAIPAALGSFRTATATWQDLGLPYETAQARLGYGLALRAAGDEDGATLELGAARAAFERLGAAPDAARAAGALRGAEADMLPAGLSAREAEVLREVASGKSNREIAASLVISEHTVARHLQNIFAKAGVSSRSAATAFAFEHGLA